MDFLPTIACMTGMDVPTDRKIDGKNILALMRRESSSSPHEALFYYVGKELQAVRSGPWKLHLVSSELYNLQEDVGETNNMAAEHPDVVKRLELLAEECRQDIGDSIKNVTGKNVRPCGKVAEPRPLTRYNPEHPYMVAMYEQRGSKIASQRQHYTKKNRS